MREEIFIYLTALFPAPRAKTPTSIDNKLSEWEQPMGGLTHYYEGSELAQLLGDYQTHIKISDVHTP